MNLHRSSRARLFWIALIIIYGLAIMPAPDAPSLGVGDKVDHIAAFLCLTLLARPAYPARSPALTGLALSAFGAFIELSQAVPFIHRDASVADWVADSIAILVGLASGRLLARMMPRAFHS